MNPSIKFNTNVDLSTPSKSKMEQINSLYCFSQEYQHYIVLINYRLIVTTNKRKLECEKNQFIGHFFKEKRNIVEFYIYTLGLTNSEARFMEFYYRNDGWGEILAKEDGEILKYFEEYDTIDNYFKNVHIPQLIGMTHD